VQGQSSSENQVGICYIVGQAIGAGLASFDSATQYQAPPAGPLQGMHGLYPITCCLFSHCHGVACEMALPQGVAGPMQMKKRRRTRTSQYRGVTRAGAKWRAAIRINNIKRELGVFETEAEAAR